jgi:glycosyltransferase involved in cell wall biosynthesis
LKQQGRRIVFVQFGDYREAVRRLGAGGAENYYAQAYSVQAVADIARRGTHVTVVCCTADYAPGDAGNGVWTAGVNLYPSGQRARHKALRLLLEHLAPTDLILCSPLWREMAWALRRGIAVLPLFADSFRADGWRSRLRAALLAWLLNRRSVLVVSNHHVASCEDLVRIGVSPGKVVPFDWPPVMGPSTGVLRRAPPGGRLHLLYVGQLSHDKGVGDLLRAMRLTSNVSLTLIGTGPDEAALRTWAHQAGLGGRVRFAGALSHAQVVQAMRTHDAAVVASRHGCPEGLPMTIYEAMCADLPIIASDHPMFARRLVSGRNALVFDAGDAVALSACIRQLAASSELYERLARASRTSAAAYLCPLKWQQLIEDWLQRSPSSMQRLYGFSLDRHAYA